MSATQSKITDSGTTMPALEEAESLARELKRLLVHSEFALHREGLKEDVEKMERWLETYRRGLAAAQKVSDNGMDLLHKTRDQLKLSLDEMYRLENEGGNPLSKEQAKQTEELNHAINTIDTLLPSVEHAFQPAENA